MILLSLVAFALPLVFADVEFTSPIAGADVSVGTINVQWKDSGRAPPIADLTQYTLDLMVGGNDVDNMLSIDVFRSGGDFDDSNTVQGTIGAGITGPVPNGFFFRMTSTSSSGGNVINFSDRFTITGLTGITDPTYRNAAAALNGDTRGPPREGNVPAITSSSSASTRPTNSRSSTGSQQTVTVTTGGGSHPTVRFSLTNPNHNSGPDTGVIVGAVVACIAFLFAIIGIGIWIFIRRKRRCVGAAHLDDKDELGKQPSVSVTALSELSAEGRVVEMGNGVPPPEMDSNSVRAELEGDCGYEPSEMLGTPVGTLSPLTPIAPSISEETLGSPTSPASGV